MTSRRRAYSANKDWTKNGRFEKSISEWFDGWNELGFDMHSIESSKYFWWDFEVLRFFNKYGVRKFMFEDIWDLDWESCRRHGIKSGEEGLPEFVIKKPPAYIRKFTEMFFGTINKVRYSY